MKGLCFFAKNALPKKDLTNVLRAIVRKFKIHRNFDDDYINFLVNFNGRTDINLDAANFKLTVAEDESTRFFRRFLMDRSGNAFFKEPDGEVSQICLIASIEDYHFPVYGLNNFESVLFQLINIGGMKEEFLFQVAETESDQRGLHMSLRKEDFGTIYYNQDVEHEPLPFGLHKVANNFSEFMNSLRLCIATSSSPYSLIIKELGYCTD